MAWLPGALAALCLVIGGLHLIRLLRLRRDRGLEAGYAGMAFGMAAMYSPLGDPVPAPAWAVLFLLCGGWFLGLIGRARSVTALGGEAAHLVVGSAAMLFMLAAGSAHAAHVVGATVMSGAASAVAVVLAGYFVLHTLRCVDRLTAARSPAAAPDPVPDPVPDPAATSAAVAVRAPVRAGPCPSTASAVAHLLMTVIMAVMLVGMI